MRTKHRMKHRFIALFLAVATILTSLNILAYVRPVIALGEDGSVTIRNDAMHFFFRHWHTDKDEDSVLNPGEEQGNDQDDYFVVVEGYIMPNTDPKIEGKYVCYAVNQGNDDYDELVPIGDVLHSPYIEDFDPETGKLILKTKFLIDSDPNIDDPVEQFAGISISAGHAAVISSNKDFIIIQYKDDIHLVKGHVFYQNKSRIVTGTYDTAAFAATDLFKNEEIDTAWAYIYKEDHNDTYGDHKAGDLVMSRANYEQACTDLNDLPDGTTEGDVKLTKFYSTAPGLHTDKTVVQTTDGRTFLYDLETWYTEGYAAQVGLVLDASGSMAFALDKPSVINVKDLGLDNQFTDKIKFLQKYGTFTKKDDLIGYYEFSKNANNDDNTGVYRTWFLNSANDPYTNYKTQTDFSEAKSGNFAKTVKQPTQTDVQNGNFAFSPSNPVWQPSDFNSIQGGSHTGWGTPPVGFSHTEGFYLTNNKVDVGTSGILLDVNPKSYTDFTISFTLQQTDDGACSSDIEILYIGPEVVTSPTQKYFHVYRTGNDIVAEYGGESVIRFSGAFSKKGDKHTVSFAFDQDGMTTYWDGAAQSTPAAIDGLTAEVVVLAPFDDSNEQLKYFAIDNVYLFDAVLDKDELGDLLEIAGKPFVSVQKNVSAFLTEAELALILNTHKIDNSYLGFADYSYYIYNPASGTAAYCPITYYSNTNADITYARKTSVNGKGWYYLKCSSNLANDNYKNIVGLKDGAVFTDTIVNDTTVSDIGAAPDVETITGNSGVTYAQSGGNGPMKFYIDSEWNLRCFFSSSEEYAYTSFVYELEDEDYIRTEGLQRVLGSFANTLNDRSPSAQLSAVQFSNNTTDTTGKLLLDWTSDSNRMAELLSLNKGNGKASGQNAYGESNYTLTGGTNTDKGLAAFRKLLASKDYKHDENEDNDISPRYLILFTDGEYDDAAAADLANQANILKGINRNPDGGDNYDYTIFVVLLTDTEEETNKTKNLAGLAGKNGVSVTDAKSGLGTDGKRYYFHISDLDELAHAFMEDIINQVIDDMDGYTVKDYIDPRFDLQSATGEVWHLNAKGEVVIGKGESAQTITVNADSKYTFRLSGDTDPAARTPYLRYDAENDMYYLEWEDQIIPTCGVGSDRMEVWVAQVWVRAKDDFIGGNAVLVGGNAAEMNWVYHPDDLDASSGTDDALQDSYKDADGKDTGTVDPYRSKGFPRVTVNVALLPLYTNPLDNVIYMGEAISPRLILTELKDEYVTDSYYLEYLKRYAYQRYVKGFDQVLGDQAHDDMDRPLLDLLTEWLEFDNEKNPIKAFSIPYFYLPQVEWDESNGKIALNPDGTAKTIYNNVGNIDINGRDVVGVLTYRWEQLNPEPLDPYDPIKEFVKSDTERVKYSLTVEFTPLQVGDSFEIFDAIYQNSLKNSGGNTQNQGKTISLEEEYPIVTLVEGDENGSSGNGSITGIRKGFFEDYLMIDKAFKGEVTSNTRLDREKYINGDPTATDHRGTYRLIQDDDYPWNKVNKPSVGLVELIDTSNLSAAKYPYGTAVVMNEGRTLTAFSEYTLDVVSGEVVLEMKLLYGELTELLEKSGWDAKTNTVTATFEQKVTRSFTDTALIEGFKKKKLDAGEKWEDYGKEFLITFEFSLTKAEVVALEKEAQQDADGYVTVFAKVVKFETTFGEKDTVWAAEPTPGSKELLYVGLPIGSYTFTVDNTNDGLGRLSSAVHFATVENEEKDDLTTFQKAYAYFNQRVLRGLNSINENPILKWNPKLRVKGSEITKANTLNFVSEAETANKKTSVTFYLGTDVTDHRGKVTEGIDRYTNARLGIVTVSTGMTKLTIQEKGGQSNESFLYRIKGRTLGGVGVDLIVSVQGGDFTTIVIPPGNYTVTEISDWSWRYDNKKTYGLYDDDADGKLHENWKIDSSDWKKATVSLRYRDDLPENDGHETIEEHKTVVYEHERNDKVWLGGENYQDNHFAGVK